MIHSFIINDKCIYNDKFRENSVFIENLVFDLTCKQIAVMTDKNVSTKKGEGMEL